jgi:acyl carrier protein
MTPEESRDLLEQSIRAVVPDASLDGLEGDTDLRDWFELDSLDYLTVTERLSMGAGVRIEDDDDLRTIDAVVDRLRHP